MESVNLVLGEIDGSNEPYQKCELVHGEVNKSNEVCEK